MEKILDCRGLECPKPVLETIKALEQGGFNNLTIQVDNLTAKENLTRLAKSKNLDSKVETKPFGYEITIQIGDNITISEKQENKAQGPIYLIKSDKLGEGSDELGKILMNGFLFTLSQTEPTPKKIVLLNSGVYLSAQVEESIRHLQDLEAKGTQIYSCGTCLNFYNLTEKLQVGEIGNMYDVVESITGDTPAISI